MPSGDRHSWNSWTAYVAAHEGHLGDFRDHFLIEDRLRPDLTKTVAYWKGELIFINGFEIHVDRRQAVQMRKGVPWVRTERYSYQAVRRERGVVRKLFRYDNIHAHRRHPSPHHRHSFDENGREVRPVKHVGEDGWPTLGNAIDELHAIWLRERTGG